MSKITKDMINKNKLPTVYFTAYVKYHTSHDFGPYLVGFNSVEEANKFLADNPKLSKTEVHTEFPWYLILEWEKKDGKKKKEATTAS